MLEAAADPNWKQGLMDATQQAVDHGVFGAPTFRVNGNLIWGQDRIALLERVLQGWAPASLESA